MRRTIMMALLLSCILLVGAVPVAQSDDPMVITVVVADGQTYNVNEGQRIILRNAWGDCSKASVMEAVTAWQAAYEVSSSGYSASDYYSPGPQNWSSLEDYIAPDSPICRKQIDDKMWKSEWLYTLGTLPVGVYHVHFHSSIIRDYVRPWGNCGTPCWVPAGSNAIDVNFTIIVE